MKVKIYDDQFGHVATCNDMPSKHIEWQRSGPDTPTCFFTGRSLGRAKSVNCKTKVAWLIEPSGIRPESYFGDYLDDFDYVLTFDRKFIGMDPKKILFYPFGCSWVPENERMIYEKTKLVSMVCSGKTYSPGHRFRNKIYDTYSGSFDGYGKYKNPIKNKADALRDYMFSICVQNTKTDDYFTEIIMDCFMTGTVPIFWGTDNIGNYFNDAGIIKFNNEAELGKVMQMLSEDYYKQCKEAISDNFVIAKQYFSPEDYVYSHYQFLFEDMK